MRYSKTHVNEIVHLVINAADRIAPALSTDATFQHDLELIREAHLLIDRRTSSIPEYRSEIIRDFMELKLSYKELMKKYHCSMRTVRSLLLECAEDDERIYNEMEFRRH